MDWKRRQDALSSHSFFLALPFPPSLPPPPRDQRHSCRRQHSDGCRFRHGHQTEPYAIRIGNQLVSKLSSETAYRDDFARGQATGAGAEILGQELEVAEINSRAVFEVALVPA